MNSAPPPVTRTLRCRFAGCELDAGARELRREGLLRAVEPKALDLLVYLIEHRDRVVGKDELQDALWPGVIVTEGSLNQAVMKARRAIGDDSTRQSLIRTVARRGYRFVGELESAPRQASRDDAPLPEPPPVRFVRSGGVHLAWRTLGDGGTDILFQPGFVSHLDLRFRIPEMAAFDSALARQGRLLMFDKRGVGLSDRVGQPPTLEQGVDDMLAVMDAAGSRQAVLFGVSEGGPAAALLAALHPARCRALILYGSFAKGLRSADFPGAVPREVYDAWLERLLAGWGGPAGIELFAPSRAGDRVLAGAWAEYLRAAASPGGVRAVLEVLREIDVREVLPTIRVPTLVIHREGDRMIRVGAGRDMAARIPGARLAVVPGEDHWWFTGDTTPIHTAIASFIAGLEPTAGQAGPIDSLLAAVLCVEAADPSLLDALADLATRHHGRAWPAVGRRRLASFGGPTRALACARALRELARQRGLVLRAAVHAGEVTPCPSGLEGPALQAGWQLAACAAPGEILLSVTVRDLLPGSGLEFSELRNRLGPQCCRLVG